MATKRPTAKDRDEWYKQKALLKARINQVKEEATELVEKERKKVEELKKRISSIQDASIELIHREKKEATAIVEKLESEYKEKIEILMDEKIGSEHFLTGRIEQMREQRDKQMNIGAQAAQECNAAREYIKCLLR